MDIFVGIFVALVVCLCQFASEVIFLNEIKGRAQSSASITGNCDSNLILLLLSNIECSG